MGWTKQELVEQAYEELGLAPDVFNISPERMQSGLRKLDSMMAKWYGRGIRLGYTLPTTPSDSVLDQDSGLPDVANEVVYLSLAIRIGPSVGKAATPTQMSTAREGFEILLSRAAFPPEQQFPNTLPRGAGNKPWRRGRPFMPTPTDPLVASDGGDQIEFD